jgi:hypothetical protein
MPVEGISCPTCGSPEVTEFKPSRYACQHCGGTFKYISPAAASVSGCQIEGCGVPAVGRCQGCSRRFCKTHQAKDFSGDVGGIFLGGGTGKVTATYFDRCSHCQGQRQAENARA